MNPKKVQLLSAQELQSVEKETIGTYYQAFGSSGFMLHESQGISPFVTQNAYDREEKAFKGIVREILIEDILEGANVISTLVFYKVKKYDDEAQSVKARIAVHGNKNKEKNSLRTDSATCSPVGIRILTSIAVVLKWTLAKIDF